MLQVEIVIYEPPKAKSELPHLVVTLAPSGLSVQPAKSRTEARALVASKRLAQSELKKKQK